ncbi:hypothetical protein [Pilimelia columellifera]|uniref:Integral membrane protein n=1 Tax=Pilimelia columellifera subsp. columellifera TaxID=706583 RepID=A0ABP6AF74_9ACTN
MTAAADEMTGPAPATLRWAAALVAAEAGGLGLLSAYLLYADLTGEAASQLGALLVTAFVVAAAVAVAAMARALGQRRGGARGPAVVTQLFLLAAAYYMVTGGLVWAGVPLAVYALVAGAALIASATTTALGLRRRL